MVDLGLSFFPTKNPPVVTDPSLGDLFAPATLAADVEHVVLTRGPHVPKRVPGHMQAVTLRCRIKTQQGTIVGA